MNFDWNDRDRAVRQRVADLLDRETEAEIEALEEVELPGIRGILGRQSARLAEAGYLGLAAGPQHPDDWMVWLAAAETLAEWSGSLFLAVETSVRLLGGLLAGWGFDGIKADLLEPLRAGYLIGGVALSEPGGPEPAPGPLTQGRLEGDEYVVSGRKSFVTNGPLADVIAVSGAVGGAVAGDSGWSAFFLVQPGQDGLVVGPRMRTLGYQGLTVCSLELTGVRVPIERVIGPFDDRAPLDFLKNMQDLILAVASLGVIKRVMDGSNRHARTHHRGAKPVYAHQEVRFKLADMFTLYQTAQWMVRRAVWLLATGDREARVMIDCAKVFAAEAADRVANQGLQVTAGLGYLSGNPVERGFREAKYAGLAGTSTEIARMNIAQDTLKRYPY